MEFERHQKVLVRSNKGIWIIDEFLKYPSYLFSHPYICKSGLYQECIPYLGNEDLYGTNKSAIIKKQRENGI